jgi:drug/metabolite transporter (DMT)-like permease
LSALGVEARVAGGARPALAHLTLGIIALSFTAVLFRVSELGPAATAFYRTVLALPIFIAWLSIERRRTARLALSPAILSRRDTWALLFGGAVYAANMACYAWAVRLTTVANASLLSNMTPIFVSLGGFLFFRERPSVGLLASMAGAILGVGILTSEKIGLGQRELLGDGVAILSAIAFAAYLTTLGRLRRHLSSAAILLLSGLTSAFCLLIAAGAAGESLIPRTPAGWAIVAALAIASYALGQGLLTVALARLSATFSAVALLSLPAIAAMWGWTLLGEPFSARQAIGGVVILLSVLGARLAGR